MRKISKYGLPIMESSIPAPRRLMKRSRRIIENRNDRGNIDRARTLISKIQGNMARIQQLRDKLGVMESNIRTPIDNIKNRLKQKSTHIRESRPRQAPTNFQPLMSRRALDTQPTRAAQQPRKPIQQPQQKRATEKPPVPSWAELENRILEPDGEIVDPTTSGSSYIMGEFEVNIPQENEENENGSEDGGSTV